MLDAQGCEEYQAILWLILHLPLIRELVKYSNESLS